MVEEFEMPIYPLFCRMCNLHTAASYRSYISITQTKKKAMHARVQGETVAFSQWTCGVSVACSFKIKNHTEKICQQCTLYIQSKTQVAITSILFATGMLC